MAFETEFQITWGDCDPAGIVFYPRYFYWFDTTYQRWLAARGLSQAILQERYGVIGTGALDTGAKFHAASRDGDHMSVRATAGEWKAKSFRITYRCLREGRLLAEGFETRGWLELVDGRVRAGTIPDAFRQALSDD